MAGFGKKTPLLREGDVNQVRAITAPFIERLLKYFEPERKGVAIFVRTADFTVNWTSRQFRLLPPEKREKYVRVAEAKMETAWYHKKDTAMVRASEFRPGQTHWPGGVYRDGIAVGVSGALPYLDYLIATIVVTIIKHMTMLGLLSLAKEVKDFIQ